MLAREKLPAESKNGFPRLTRHGRTHRCPLLSLSLFLSSSSRVLVFHAFFPRDAFLAGRKLTREYFIFKGSAPKERASLQGGKRNSLTGREGTGWGKRGSGERAVCHFIRNNHPLPLAPSLSLYLRLVSVL